MLCALALVGQALLTGPVAAQENLAALLSSSYASLRSQLEANPLGVPLLVTSFEEGDTMRGEIHALLPQPFDQLAARLSVPRDWCQIVLLHLNIKACTHERETGQDWLTFYAGRKVYEDPEDAYPLRFAFRAAHAQAEHLDLDLRAAIGPMGTSEYQIRVGAIPVAQGSFLRFSYSFRSSALSRIALNIYLATLGFGKIGFTVVGTGPDGTPEHVGGSRGIAERNAVRYYFAIQTYLEGLAVPGTEQFERNLERWFELTERHPTQLRELDKPQYLQAKRKEFEQQTRRQKELDSVGNGGQPDPDRSGRCPPGFRPPIRFPRYSAAGTA